jgi:hypothetical protein
MARPEGGSPYTIDRQARPDEWLRAVYSDASIITQRNDRRLWDEITDAYVWWVTAGEPGYQRFGLTVGPDRPELWLDDPARVVPGR